MTKVWPSKVYPVEMGAITSGKIRIYKEKTKGIFEIAKLKKEASSGEEISGPQPVNNSLASFRHQRGRSSTDPRPANACTTLFFFRTSRILPSVNVLFLRIYFSLKCSYFVLICSNCHKCYTM